MYAFSILFMIGSSLRQNQQDMEAHGYLKEVHGFHFQRLARKRDKAITRRFMERLSSGGTPVPTRGPDAPGGRGGRGGAGSQGRRARDNETSLLGDDLRRSSGSSSWSLYSLQQDEESVWTPMGTPVSSPGTELSPDLPNYAPLHPRATTSSSLPLFGVITGRPYAIPEIPEITVELVPTHDTESSDVSTSHDLTHVLPHDIADGVRIKRTDAVLHTDL